MNKYIFIFVLIIFMFSCGENSLDKITDGSFISNTSSPNPSVIWTSVDNGVINKEADITIRFSVPMNSEKTLESISLSYTSSDSPSSINETNYILSSESDTEFRIVFTNIISGSETNYILMEHHNYTLKVDSEKALSADSKTLNEDFTRDFEINDITPPSLIQTIDGSTFFHISSTNLGSDFCAITFTFSEDMNFGSVIDAFYVLDTQVNKKYSHNNGGELIPINDSTYRFVWDAVSMNRNYLAKVLIYAEDLEGNRLKQSYSQLWNRPYHSVHVSPSNSYVQYLNVTKKNDNSSVVIYYYDWTSSSYLGYTTAGITSFYPLNTYIFNNPVQLVDLPTYGDGRIGLLTTTNSYDLVLYHFSTDGSFLGESYQIFIPEGSMSFNYNDRDYKIASDGSNSGILYYDMAMMNLHFASITPQGNIIGTSNLNIALSSYFPDYFTCPKIAFDGTSYGITFLISPTNLMIFTKIDPINGSIVYNNFGKPYKQIYAYVNPFESYSLCSNQPASNSYSIVVKTKSYSSDDPSKLILFEIDEVGNNTKNATLITNLKDDTNNPVSVIQLIDNLNIYFNLAGTMGGDNIINEIVGTY